MNTALTDDRIIPCLYPKYGKRRQVNSLDSFVISAIAPAGAVVFTNPFDTAKVRLQLQGQLIKKLSTTNQVIYKNSFDTIHKIYLNEGIRGLQKGLTPAILRESSKNFFRIGMYDPIMTFMHDPKQGSAPAWKRLVAGSLCGVMGAFSCNPFELVKTRLQSASAGPISVGQQHHYKSTWDALKSIVNNDGPRGLYKGSVLSMGRSIVGSGTNLTTFTMMKEDLMLNRGWKDSKILDVVCGLGSSVISVIFMNPIDVIRTRYYNQSKVAVADEVFYTSGVDAAKKIFINEGPSAFYKGLLTHFFRIGPHFCFTFLFLGILRRQLNGYYDHLDKKESFAYFDHDGDGKLNGIEVKLAIEEVFLNSGAKESEITRFCNQILDNRADSEGFISFGDYKSMVEDIYGFSRKL